MIRSGEGMKTDQYFWIEILKFKDELKNWKFYLAINMTAQQ